MDTLDIFRQIKKIRVSDTVVNQIISLIDDGKLKPGNYLPSERELMSKFQVARASVREALRILEFQGIIEVQSGKGAFIVDDVKSANEEVVRRWFKVHASEDLELLEVCEALECRAARLAAMNPSQELIEEIQATLNEAEVLTGQEDIPKLVYLDRKFHRLVKDASGNHLLSQLIDMTNETLPGPRQSLFYINDRAKMSWGQHRAILNAIIAHDPVTADQTMEEHIASVRTAIVDLIDNAG
jgi:GntR family transcriptional repressor for pyruvate dehydrogenase complex